MLLIAIRIGAFSDDSIDCVFRRGRRTRRRVFLIKMYGIFQAFEICSTIRTFIKMEFNRTTVRRIQVFIEIHAKMFVNFITGYLFFSHVVTYSVNCSRNVDLARCNLDFTAATVKFNTSAVSCADRPSISRSTNTTL